MVRLSALVLLLVAMAVSAQPPAPTPPEVKVYMVGDDTVIILPPGMEYLTEKSKYVGGLPKVVVDGQKLIIRKAKMDVKNVGGSKLTLQMGGTFFSPTIHVGIPEGAVYKAPEKKPDATPKK